MKKILLSIGVLFYCLCACAFTESEGVSFIKSYYRDLSEYAAAENIELARKIERMHVGGGHVYPDVEINLGNGMTEIDGVGIKTMYLASIMSRQDLLLKFVPKNITLVSNSNGICSMEYTLYVYSGNEQPGTDVLKYTVPLKIEIQNNDKKIRSILKRTKSTSPQYTLSVDPSYLTFDASGGTRTITINSNTNWSISLNTRSWGHLTTNGNTLTLRVDPHTGTTDRDDYFKIKAGDKEEKISIIQKAKVPSSSIKPAAQIKRISVSKDQDLDDGKGLIIHVAFDIQNMKDKDVRVSAYFYDNAGNALTDTNDKYHTTDGKVSTGISMKPTSDNSSFNDLQLKIPYTELHQSGINSKTLKFSVSIWDRSVSPSKEITESSSYTTFSYTPEIVLLVDNTASDRTKYFSASGGRETYYINTTASSYETWGVPSWCRIENKTSSSFTLVCEPNNTSSQHSDYMKVKAGGKEIRIDIKQESGKSATRLSLSENTINASRSGTPSGRCYPVEVYTDGENVTATANVGWIDVDVVDNTVQIKTDRNPGSRRTATVTVKVDNLSKQITVSQGGVSNCMNCYNWSYMRSTGQVWSVSGQYWNPILCTWIPQYGWIRCPKCGGSGSVED